MALRATRDLFEIARKKQDFLTVCTEEVSLEIPILPDVYGFTPIDICLGIVEHNDKQNLEIFKELEEDEKLASSSLKNNAMASEILKNLCQYGFMHSSYFLTNAIIEALD